MKDYMKKKHNLIIRDKNNRFNFKGELSAQRQAYEIRRSLSDSNLETYD